MTLLKFSSSVDHCFLWWMPIVFCKSFPCKFSAIITKKLAHFLDWIGCYTSFHFTGDYFQFYRFIVLFWEVRWLLSFNFPFQAWKHFWWTSFTWTRRNYFLSFIWELDERVIHSWKWISQFRLHLELVHWIRQ